MMTYRLQDLIDIEHFQELQDRLNEIYAFPSSIIDNDGNILTATAWQEICTQFHRKNREAEKICIKSDQYIKDHIHQANPALSYRCPHGLVDNVTPIIIDGIHYGNFFTGQFFMEEPDLAFFRAQARKYGFDEDAYLRAVKKVPVWSQKQLDSYLFFIKGLIAVISESGLKQLKEIENRKQIQKSEKRYRALFESMAQGAFYQSADGVLFDYNDAALEMFGLTPDQFVGKTSLDPQWKVIQEDGTLLPGDKHPSMVALQTGNPVKDAIVGVFNPQIKNYKWLLVNAIPQFHSPGEKPYQVFVTLQDITERKQAEQKYQTLFREMIDGFALHEIICDEKNQPVDYRFMAVNPAFERLTGLKADSLIGKTVLEVMPNTEPYWIKTYGKVALTGEHAFFENYSQELDRYFQVRAFRPARKQFACIFVDVTERKRAELRQRKLEAQLSSAMEIAHLGHWEYDVTEDRFDFTDQFYKIFRTSAAQVGGYQMSSAEYAHRFVHPEDRHLVGEEVVRCIETPDPDYSRQLEHRILYADGKVGHIAVRFFIVKDPNGRTIKTYGVNQDITERKQAELALRESEEKFRSFTEQSFVGFYIIQDGIFKYVNPKFAEIFGYTVEECLDGMHFRRLVHPEDLDHVQEQVRKRVTGEMASAHYTFRGVKKTGSVIHVSIYGSAITFQGRPAAIGTMLDITKELEMENRMAQSQRMEAIGSLAGGIAHDFNNILFPIVGLSEMLMEDLDPASPEHENAREIYFAGRRGGDLVKQILTFSRQAEQKKMPIRIQQILREVMKLIRPTIPANIPIIQDIQDDCPLVLANPTQVHQIAMNLITNAYHAVEQKNGEISIQLKETAIKPGEISGIHLTPGRYAHLSVSDTGDGIDPAVVGKIFEPYFTTKEQGKGTGLGLAVVYGIVKDHQGEITVRSELGRGATFAVYLPIMEKTEKSALVDERREDPTGHEHILLVDDEEPIVRLEKQMLERLGYRVTSRVSSAEALAVFKENPDWFDLIITDMSMPNMTGDRLAGEIIAVRPGIPIIICTGFSERINKEKAAAIGVKGFLMKPIVKPEMAGMVRKVLDGVTGKERQ